MFIETSQDFFFLILAFSILTFTIFLCWLLYQAARVLRNANNIIENLMHKLELITDAVDYIREKVDGMSSNLGFIGSTVSGLIEKYVVGKLVNTLEEPPAKKKVKKKSGE